MKIKHILGASALSFAIVSCASTNEEFPATVTAKLDQLKGSGEITETEAEKNDDGVVTYEATVENGNKTVQYEFDKDGNILMTESPVKPAKLPGVVSKAIFAQFPGATVTEADHIVKGSKAYYEIELEDAKGVEYEMEIDTKGKVLSSESEEEHHS